MFVVSVTGGDQLRAVGVKLKAAGPEMRKNLRVNIVAAVKPMQTAVREDALGIPAKGPRSTGLRRQIASATRMVIRLSGGPSTVVRLWVNPGAMPAGKSNLPALMEGERAWRKPVFGNREVWRGQPSHPYFAPGVVPLIPGVRVAVARAVKETADSI